MHTNFKIHETDIQALIKQAETKGIAHVIYLIRYQLLEIKQKNRKLKIFILLKKFNNLLDNSNAYKNEISFYKDLLTELNKIPLTELEEYQALKEFLEGVSDS